MKAVTLMAEMTSFLKSKAGYYDQNQENTESAASILVETLSNILSVANTSQEGQVKFLKDAPIFTSLPSCASSSPYRITLGFA